MSIFVWKQVTRNCHTAHIEDMHVCTVLRSQKNRRDGTKHDWIIEVLNSRFWKDVFNQHDPKDLESTKHAAEAKTKWAIRELSRALRVAAREVKP